MSSRVDGAVCSLVSAPKQQAFSDNQWRDERGRRGIRTPVPLRDPLTGNDPHWHRGTPILATERYLPRGPIVPRGLLFSKAGNRTRRSHRWSSSRSNRALLAFLQRPLRHPMARNRHHDEEDGLSDGWRDAQSELWLAPRSMRTVRPLGEARRPIAVAFTQALHLDLAPFPTVLPSESAQLCGRGLRADGALLGH